MILPDKALESTTSLPLDAPPAYEESTTQPVAGPSRYPADTKHQPAQVNASSPPKTPQSTAGSWFGFASPATRQVRTTVLGLVRDLVKTPADETNSAVATSILKSCAEACSANGLSLSALLQEKSIEGHTAIYWAIVKRPAVATTSADASPPSSLDLLTALLSLAAPLTADTISDIRLACLLTSDQALFQRLRSSAPDFSPLSPTDQLLLDASSPPDSILVENTPHDEFAFGVDFTIVRFQTRMRVSKCVELDFIARGRMWRLGFHVSERRRPGMPAPGAWYITLSLLEHSPPTWIDSRLLVPAPEAPQPSPPPASGFGSGFFGSGKTRSRPTLSVRMKAAEQLHANPRGHRRKEIIMLLDEGDGESGLGTLQYAGCPYIQPDESLHCRLEARLARPEAECIIC
ncbi:hypothetical protein MKEN_01075500 [Mycena kentingensis (nom. inval.)]|nr:hypothetical protein MKEN_01075500 [Mycena kentingensis (nom. inval.)]